MSVHGRAHSTELLPSNTFETRPRPPPRYKDMMENADILQTKIRTDGRRKEEERRTVLAMPLPSAYLRTIKRYPILYTWIRFGRRSVSCIPYRLPSPGIPYLKQREDASVCTCRSFPDSSVLQSLESGVPTTRRGGQGYLAPPIRGRAVARKRSHSTTPSANQRPARQIQSDSRVLWPLRHGPTPTPVPFNANTETGPCTARKQKKSVTASKGNPVSRPPLRGNLTITHGSRNNLNSTLTTQETPTD